MIDCPTLRNSQVTAREAEATPVLSSLYYCYSLQPQKHASTMWSITRPLVGAERATISHLKEEILSYLQVPKKIIFSINRYSLCQVKNNLFQHDFGVCRPQLAFLHILAYHSATSWGRLGYHTPYERGHP